MGNLYLTGGEQLVSAFLPAPEWHANKKAIVLRVDTATGKVTDKLEYLTPPNAGLRDNVSFKGASLFGNKLYACTCTEVIGLELPGFRQIHYVSLPCFNDLHHVLPTPKGTLIAVVTGLDMVVEITLEGDVLREWSVTGEDTWSRFSREIDYRQVATTKPHRAHPNFAFLLGEDIWTTRCDYKDAVCLTRPDHRIDISVGYPHDGHVFGDWVYFTTVDAHIVIANSYSRKVEQIFDLNTIDNPQGHVLGWCRGVLPVTETLIWVGFTRLRHTKFVEKLSWLKKSPFDSRPSRIALYDLSAGSCLQEIDLSAHGMDMVFSVVAFPSFDEANLHLTRTDISSCVE